MPQIHLTTSIAAPRERVFDLARSIDAHIGSMKHASERAVAGRTSGLIELGEKVTWEANHFGVRQRLTVAITKMNPPFSFTDEMVSGVFASLRHDHRFEENQGVTVMTDIFEFRAPIGLLGRLAERLFLTRYMRKLLERRNHFLKTLAES